MRLNKLKIFIMSVNEQKIAINLDKINYLVQKFEGGGKGERIANSAFKFFDNAREIFDRATSGNFWGRLWNRWTADDQSDAKTFDEAYSNARKNGSKTFIWNNKHYSTDYSGEHHKKYEEDLESGKAAAWEKEYPGFTNPELRKAKQEELDTYGITNEQTQNKTYWTRTLQQIPARGYNVSDALSTIVGEYTPYQNYNNPEDLIKAIRKKYPMFNDFKIDVDKHPADSTRYTPKIDILQYYKYLQDNNISRDYLTEAFERDMTNIEDHFGEDAHRQEFNLLIGVPTIKSEHSPIISNYRTGKSAYYYTTPDMEKSQVWVPKSMEFLAKTIIPQGQALQLQMEKSSVYQNRPKRSDFNSDKSYEEALKKYMTNNHLFFEKYYSLGGFKDAALDYFDNKSNDYLYNIGLTYTDKGLSIYDFDKFKNASQEDIMHLANLEVLQNTVSPNLAPGNYIFSNSGTTDYYLYGQNDGLGGKYTPYINGLLKIIGHTPVKNELEQDAATLRLRTGHLGAFTVGVPKDTTYISVYDKFDIDPFGRGNDKPIFLIGKPFEYYTRFYKEKTPNIDSLYNNFKWTPNKK